MAELDPNNTVAETSIKVNADLEEFQRSIDDALADVERRFAEAADNAGKGFTDKVGAALDSISLKLGEIIEKSAGLKLDAPQTNQQNKQQESQQSDPALMAAIRDLTTKVDESEKRLTQIDSNVAAVVVKMGNIR